MIYYTDEHIKIRTMKERDAAIFTEEEILRGRDSDVSKLLRRFNTTEYGE